MSESRTYVVTDEQEPKAAPRFVEANSRAQAIGHCVRNRYKARAATVADFKQYRDATIEDATGDE